MLTFVLLFSAAYILGSINFSIGVLKLAGKDDPRKSFSRNPGATNVYRQEGMFMAVLVLSLDVGRALIVAVIAQKILSLAMLPWVGFGLILGNRFPVFHRFRGGKGVANYLGFTVMLAPLYTVVGIIAWGITFYLWRTPFLSSFAMIFFLAMGTIIEVSSYLAGISGVVCTAVFIICCHHQNISGWLRMRLS